MKVIAAATLLTLLVAPSTYAANTRRLGAVADVSDFDNRRLSMSMDLKGAAAIEPAGDDDSYDDDWSWSKTKKSGVKKSGGKKSGGKKSGVKGSEKSKKSGGKGKGSTKKSGGSGMMAATSGGPEGADALLLKILEVLGDLGVEIPAPASGVEPAFDGLIIEAIIESIIDAIFGYGGSKSGKGSKSGDHDYYYYEGDSKSGKGESKSAKRA